MTGRPDVPDRSSASPWQVHVEQTRLPNVLRWVCRRRDLVDDVTPPSGSALAMLIDDDVRWVVGRDGDLVIAFTDAGAVEDTARVRRVHDAVVATLRIDPWTRGASLTPVTLRSRHRPHTTRGAA